MIANRFVLFFILMLTFCATPLAAWTISEDLHLSAYLTQEIDSDFNDCDSCEVPELNDTLFAIQISSRLSNALLLRTEVESDDQGVQGSASLAALETQTSLKPEIVVASLQYSFLDTWRADVGLLRQPFGLFNEIRNIGITYPMTSLPLNYSPLSGFLSKNFRGLSIQNRMLFGQSELLSILYYGETISETPFSNEGGFAFDRINMQPDYNQADASSSGISIDAMRFQNMVGGHIELNDALPGLKFSASGYSAWIYDGAQEDNWHAWALGVHYDSKYFVALAEWFRANDAQESSYGLVGVRFWPEWLLYVSADRFYADRVVSSDNHLSNQAVGLNWEINANLALKGKYAWKDLYLGAGIVKSSSEQITLALSVGLF